MARLKSYVSGGSRGACLLAFAAAMAAVSARAAVSNAIELDNIAVSTPRFLTTNVVSFAIDWNSGLVPSDATTAVMTITGNHYKKSIEVAKPAESISCSLDGPIYNDTLSVTLDYKAGGATRAAFKTSYALRKGAFGSDRVLTVETTDNLWRICRLPLDLPFDEKWFVLTPTYFATSNLVTGLNCKPVAPLDGPAVAYGVLPLTRKKCGSPSRLNMKIWAGNYRMANIDLDGRMGLSVLVR